MKLALKHFAFGAGLILLTAFFVYPTLYIYPSSTGGLQLRVNRITGIQEFATSNGWMTEDQSMAFHRAKSLNQFEARVKENPATEAKIESGALFVRDNRDDSWELIAAAHAWKPYLNVLSENSVSVQRQSSNEYK